MKADKTFNAIKYRKGRHIGGAFVGSYVAPHNIFRYHHMFSKVGRHMPALELELEYEDNPYEERQSKIHSRIYLNHAA